MITAILVFVLAIMPVEAMGEDTITGPARVIEGDTIEIHGARIRLEGIDAPESGQRCGDRACGVEATDYLRALIADQPVRCTTVTIGRYGRAISTCSVDTTDLGQGLCCKHGVSVSVRRGGRRATRAK